MFAPANPAEPSSFGWTWPEVHLPIPTRSSSTELSARCCILASRGTGGAAVDTSRRSPQTWRVQFVRWRIRLEFQNLNIYYLQFILTQYKLSSQSHFQNLPSLEHFSKLRARGTTILWVPWLFNQTALYILKHLYFTIFKSTMKKFLRSS